MISSIGSTCNIAIFPSVRAYVNNMCLKEILLKHDTLGTSHYSRGDETHSLADIAHVLTRKHADEDYDRNLILVSNRSESGYLRLMST